MKHKKLFLLMVATLLCGFSVKAQITAVSQLDNDSVYFVSQTYHAEGATSWAIAYGGTALQTNVELGIESDEADPRQQFSFITNDGGTTYYLYHPAEGKYVNRDGSLSVTPQHQIYFKAGMFDATFVVYFGSSYYINVNGERKVVIDSWAIPDKGNSCQIIPTSKGETTDTEADVSTLFVNADFETGNTTGWTVSRPSNATNFGPVNTAAKYGYQGTYFMEAWGRRANLGDFEWSQTQAVPNGTYVVTALAHAKYENDEYRIPQGVYVFAEDQQAAVTTITPSEYVLIVEVTDGKMTIGYRGVSCNVNWAASDDFRVSKPDLDAEYTVTFYDWDGTVLKTEKVKWGKSATAPADPERDGYTFAGWDKAFVSVISDLDIHASYTRNVADVTTLFVNTDFEDGTTGWTISGPENANTGTIGTAAGHSYQGTYFMEAWRSAEAGTLGNFEWSQTQTVPNGTYVVTALAHNKKENDASVTPQGTYIFANDQQVAITTVVASEYTVTVEVTDGTLTIGYRGVGCNGNWTACDHFRVGLLDTGAEYTVTFYDWDDTVLKTETVKWGESATPPADPEHLGYTFMGWDKDFTSVVYDMDIHANFARNVGGLNYTETYLISLPYHLNGATSWAIDTNGTTLMSSTTLGAAPDAADPRQQFTFISNKEGEYYLYHPASKKYVNMDGSLSDTPVDAIYFVEGAYPDTYIAYFDQTHYVNVNGNSYLVINSFSTPGEGNSFFVVPTNDSENADAEYTVTFYDWDGTELETMTVKAGQSPIPSVPVRDGYAFAGWDIDYTNVHSDLVVYATYGLLDDVLPSPIPRAEYWYDFGGVGDKGFIKGDSYTTGISQQFKTLKKFGDWGSYDYDFYYIEDINRDGVLDISTSYKYDGGDASYISEGTGYIREGGVLIIPNFDINNDGRIDYLKSSGSYSGYNIMVQQADGSFVEQFMQVVTEAEYEASFDPDDWNSTYTNQKPRCSPVRFSGVSLATAPPRREANAPMMRAQGINTIVSAPTRAIDLNADGYVDLIDEMNGVLYYNGGDGRWIYTELGGSVMVADLNGDHIQDFIFPGQELWVAVYRGANDFEVQTLYQNIQVDPEMYCYDFDRDGDVDILVTFSAPLNGTGYAYTMFFDNDGTGQFAQLDEQDYGDNNLLFSNCQDLDGDGYYDMLAYRGALDAYGRSVYCYDSEDLDVVWLRGLPNMTFAQPEVLASIPKDFDGDGEENKNEQFKDHLEKDKISAEDINCDGCMEVWASFQVTMWGHDKKYTASFPTYRFEGTRNTAPTAPAKPELIYNNGMLTIIWGDGHDERTATSDLTYALRVGSTPGGDDIVRAHANADGTRRNFLDGNMSKYQSYTLDLTQYQPGTIYVSVQTIDAQHVGSAWSEEASVEHTGFFADFRMSTAEVGLGVAMTVTAPAMPDGFVHTWMAEDGVCTGDGHEVEIVFSAAGEKTVTHTLTAADGTSMSHIEIVNVTPSYADLSEGIKTESSQFYRGGRYRISTNMVDYNMDGYWDVAGNNVIYKGGENYSFAQAAGVWNTGLTINSGFWYDWDHNGAMDFLFTEGNDYYCYLPHNGTSNMKAKQEDANLSNLLKNDYAIGTSWSVSNPMVDLTNDGNYDQIIYDCNRNGSCNLGIRQADGSYQRKHIKTATKDNFEDELWHMAFTGWFVNGSAKYRNRQSIAARFFADFNRDGFTDICALITDNTTSCNFRWLTVLVNKGNDNFELLTIPFDAELDEGYLTPEMCYLVDMNSDGYLDIFSLRPDGAPYILWNEENKHFTAPYVLPVGELDRYTSDYDFLHLVDLDNNGYLDVVTFQQDESMGDAGYGFYVHYFGEGGVVQQGFVVQGVVYGEYMGSAYKILDQSNLIKHPNHPWTLYTTVNASSYMLVPVHGFTNERPSAPTDVRAAQTAKGLLIEWSHAKDDATPGAQMRYNLSVKKKGASGEGAYIISPQNACNSNAAPISDFNYITAKQYIVPLTALPIGEYEIQLQAIDLQGDWSVFTEPLTVSVEEQYAIDAPTTVCTEGIAQFVYVGTPTTETPAWNLQGGRIESGNGYGPLGISWSTPGTKTVTLHLGDKVITHMIYVSESGADMILPTRFINHTTTELNLPEGTKVEWWMRPYENLQEEYRPPYKPMSDYDNMVTLEGNKLTLNSDGSHREWEFKILLTNDDDCDVEITAVREIYEQSELPQITMVTADDEGHNVIRWETSRLCSRVRILKETNRRDQYVEIGEVNVSDGTYTDHSSNATVQAERYVLQAVLDDLEEVPLSTPHTTSHLTINRGMTNNTWNLIWSDYEGADVEGYNILRGATPDELEEIGSISSRHNSYTDYAPDANAPYYAIEYILGEEEANAPAMNRTAARATELRGQSNVVNSNQANVMVYANKVSVLSATKKYATTEDNLSLALYAEIMPVGATSRSVRWDIVNGEDLATITSGGVLTAKNPNAGGTVTVQATTVDGTNITATRTITIAPIGEVAPEPEPETTYTVTFYDWNSAVLKTQTVKQGESATAPTPPTREGYTFSGWDKVFTNVQGDLFVYAMYTQNSVEPEPDSGLKYTVEYHHGTYGWLEGSVWYDQSQYVAGYTSPLYRSQQGKVEKLRFTVKSTSEMKKYFCLSELEIYDAEGRKIALTAENVTSNADHNALNPSDPDGGGFAALFDGQMSTYFHSAWKNMPAGDHYLEVTLPNGGYEAFSFKMLSRAYSINPSTNAIVTQTHTFPGEMVLSTAVPLTEEIVQPKPEYTVTFYDWNNAVLKTQTVQQGQSATAPANPTREGYTFTGWDKAFTNIQSDLTVTAVYTQNSVEPDPGTGELTYTTQFNAGANGWIDGAVWHNQTEKIAIYTSPLYRAQGGKVTKLRITVNRTKGNTKYFCLSELELYDANGTKIALTASNITSNADHNALNAIPDGGGLAALFDGQTSTYFHSAWQNMPAEDHYLEVTLPNGGYDAFSFKMLSRARSIEGAYVYDQSHTFPAVMVMSTAIELVVGNTPEPEPEPEPTYTVTFYDWDNTVLKTQTVVKGQSATAPAAPTREGYTFTGWDKSFTNVQANLSVKAVYTQNSVEPDPQPELDNEMLYHVAQPHHEHGATAWVVAKGGSRLQSIIELGIASDKQDARQQFMFISNDGGKTRYLYHPAERKYVNKDGSLSATPKDAVYFKSGAYANTFVVYFDNAHFVNVDQYRALLINDWGPGGRIGVADGGNSCQITAVGKYDITDIDFLRGEGIRRVQKVLENGEMFILLPDGSKYTMTGVRVK